MLYDSGIKPVVKVVILVTRTQVVETEVQLLNRFASYEDETPHQPVTLKFLTLKTNTVILSDSGISLA